MSTKNRAEGVELTARPEGAPEVPASATLQAAEIRPRTRRDQLLEALEGVTSVMLNTSREIIFTIRSNFIDSRSQIIFNVDSRHPNAVFGRESVPVLDQMPDHALEAIWRGLTLGSLINTSVTGPIARTTDYKPLQTHSRVANGMDPVKACGEAVETLNELLKGPSTTAHKDPEGVVIDMLRNRYYGEYKVLVALQYLEQCGRRRPRILTTLEDWIQDCHEKRGVTLES